MKRFIFPLICLLFLLVFPYKVHADDDWVIENFNSNISIQQTGVVNVVETISVDFRDTPEHGIYRDIPYFYQSNGQQTYTDVHIQSVQQNNTPAQYTTSQTNGYDEIKIGNPDQTIVGRNTYTITYTVTGVLQPVNNYDELYWNVTGNNWPVGIEKAEATVSLPEAGIARITCYEGLVGSQSPCQSNLNSGRQAMFVVTNALTDNEGLTVVVDYKKGLIPILRAVAPKPYFEQIFLWPSLSVFLVIIGIGIGFVFILLYRYGRDYWFARVLFGTKDQKGKRKPIGAHETISVEFTPPEKLRPAEIGVLMDERADTLDVTATIIDLATRGYMKITEIPKKWMFGKVDYLLVKATPTKRNQALVSYEQLLLNKLFIKRSQIKLSSLKATFYLDLNEVKQALYDDVISKGFFPSNPEKVRKKYLFIAAVLLFGGIWWLVYGYSHTSFFFGDGGLGCIFDGILLFFVSRYMPRRTAYGHELYRRSKGYYLFVTSSEKYRQRYFEKQNMFNEVLPYAIVFGLTKKFAKQMQKIGVKPTRTDWYVGQQLFATEVFIGSVNDFSTSLSSAISSVPSSSGGFSSGSSGGGFGGGGGGSW
jgi:uncharacterized membrane protein